MWAIFEGIFSNFYGTLTNFIQFSWYRWGMLRILPIFLEILKKKNMENWWTNMGPRQRRLVNSKNNKVESIERMNSGVEPEESGMPTRACTETVVKYSKSRKQSGPRRQGNLFPGVACWIVLGTLMFAKAQRSGQDVFQESMSILNPGGCVSCIWVHFRAGLAYV